MAQRPQDPELFKAFLDDYAAYVKEVLQPTQLRIQRLIAEWQEPEYWGKYKRNHSIPIPTPIRASYSRIKRPEQVVDKIFRKPYNYPEGLDGASFIRMHDTIGVRLVVYFLSHLPLIDRELRSSNLIEISTEVPPIAYMSADQTRLLCLDHMIQHDKESGYRSLHYILRFREDAFGGAPNPWFEVQVRTLAQDLWSALEHHLGYKPGRPLNIAARKQLTILSRSIGIVDEHFALLYAELSRFQEEQVHEDLDPLSAEVLPAVLAEVGLTCAQRDINNILMFLYSRGVETVRDLRALATPRRMDIVRNTFLSVYGRLPANLEVIATLAALSGAQDEKEEVQRIKLQIAYRGAWDSIRQDFSQEA
jgi:putative GTP pyrophosphokinase